LSEKLILRMSSQKTNPVPWLVWSDSNNEIIVSGELRDQSEMSTLAPYAKGRQVTVVANSADVRLMTHHLAMKPTRQVLKALPYMLEDELAEDIDKLHFAIESTGFDKIAEQHFVNFAVLTKSTLQQWLEVLEAHQISVKNLLPEILCLPYFEADESQPNEATSDTTTEDTSSNATVSMVSFAQGYLVREGQWQGSFIENDWLQLYASQLSNKTVHHFSELPAALTERADQGDITLVAEDPELPMLLLAQQAAKVKWNLLQGEFAPAKPVSKSWQTWRPVAVLGAVLLVIQLVMMVAETQQKQAQLAAARAELGDMYQQAFPNEKLRINLLRRQLASKVKALSSTPSAANFEFLQALDKLTPVFSQFSNVQIENMRFDGKRNELRLTASAPNFQDFEKFRVALSGMGLQVKSGAVNNEGDLVTGSISIQGGN
jgi:general secretion pathway protein L